MQFELKSYLNEILRRLQPAKDYVDTHLGDLPGGFGGAIRDIPLWLYAAAGTFLAL